MHIQETSSGRSGLGGLESATQNFLGAAVSNTFILNNFREPTLRRVLARTCTELIGCIRSVGCKATSGLSILFTYTLI